MVSALGVRVQLIALLIFVCPALAYAAPTVSAVEGSMSSGATVSITGSGFGAKSPAAPTIWEQFDGYTAGHWLKDDNAAWAVAADNGMSVTDTNCYGGKCVKNHVSNPLGVNKWATNARAITPADAVYFSYRVRTDVAGTSPYGIGKFGRITTSAPGDSYSSPGSFGLSSWNMRYNTGIGWLYIPDTTEIFTYLSTQDWMNNAAWDRHEIYQKKSTAGAADGTLYFRKGTWEYKNDAIMTRASGVDYSMQTVYLGGVAANFENGTDDSTADFYLDDVYVDTTLSRVEICSGATWGSRGVCEVQPPTAWSDTSVAATVNQGSFAAGATAYLYVVDSAGSASNGQAITFAANVPKPLRRAARTAATW